MDAANDVIATIGLALLALVAACVGIGLLGALLYAFWWFLCTLIGSSLGALFGSFVWVYHHVVAL